MRAEAELREAEGTRRAGGGVARRWRGRGARRDTRRARPRRRPPNAVSNPAAAAVERGVGGGVGRRRRERREGGEPVQLIRSRLISAYFFSHNTIYSISRALFILLAERSRSRSGGGGAGAPRSVDRDLKQGLLDLAELYLDLDPPWAGTLRSGGAPLIGGVGTTVMVAAGYSPSSREPTATARWAWGCARLLGASSFGGWWNSSLCSAHIGCLPLRMSRPLQMSSLAVDSLILFHINLELVLTSIIFLH
jgi:hypothetical protein